MIPFRLYVVADAGIGGARAAEKHGVLADEGRARVGFYLRDASLAGEALQARIAGAGAPVLVRATAPRDARAGVHLKAAEIDRAAELRAPGRLLGASAHSLAEARAARVAGADFVVFGHVFETASKAGLAPRGVPALAEVCAALAPFPVFAIGGVTPSRVAECLAAGAWGVAAIRPLLEPEDPRDALRAFLAALPG